MQAGVTVCNHAAQCVLLLPDSSALHLHLPGQRMTCISETHAAQKPRSPCLCSPCGLQSTLLSDDPNAPKA